MDKLGVEPDAIVIPVGGGGLLAGMTTVIQHLKPHMMIIVSWSVALLPEHSVYEFVVWSNMRMRPVQAGCSESDEHNMYGSLHAGCGVRNVPQFHSSYESRQTSESAVRSCHQC